MSHISQRLVSSGISYLTWMRNTSLIVMTFVGLVAGHLGMAKMSEGHWTDYASWNENGGNGQMFSSACFIWLFFPCFTEELFLLLLWIWAPHYADLEVRSLSVKSRKGLAHDELDISSTHASHIYVVTKWLTQTVGQKIAVVVVLFLWLKTSFFKNWDQKLNV